MKKIKVIGVIKRFSFSRYEKINLHDLLEDVDTDKWGDLFLSFDIELSHYHSNTYSLKGKRLETDEEAKQRYKDIKTIIRAREESINSLEKEINGLKEEL